MNIAIGLAAMFGAAALIVATWPRRSGQPRDYPFHVWFEAALLFLCGAAFLVFG